MRLPARRGEATKRHRRPVFDARGVRLEERVLRCALLPRGLVRPPRRSGVEADVSAELRPDIVADAVYA